MSQGGGFEINATFKGGFDSALGFPSRVPSPLAGTINFIGTMFPYQYRLMRPGKWDGAKEAINTERDRVFAATMTRKVPSDDESSKLAAILKLFIMVAVLVAIALPFG